MYWKPACFPRCNNKCWLTNADKYQTPPILTKTTLIPAFLWPLGPLDWPLNDRPHTGLPFSSTPTHPCPFHSWIFKAPFIKPLTTHSDLSVSFKGLGERAGRHADSDEFISHCNTRGFISYCEVILIHWTFNFMYYVGRAIDKIISGNYLCATLHNLFYYEKKSFYFII